MSQQMDHCWFQTTAATTTKSNQSLDWTFVAKTDTACCWGLKESLATGDTSPAIGAIWPATEARDFWLIREPRPANWASVHRKTSSHKHHVKPRLIRCSCQSGSAGAYFTEQPTMALSLRCGAMPPRAWHAGKPFKLVHGAGTAGFGTMQAGSGVYSFLTWKVTKPMTVPHWPRDLQHCYIPSICSHLLLFSVFK